MATPTRTGTPSGDEPGPEGLPTPPSWEQAVILARYQLRDYLRSRRFVLMLGIVAASGAILTALVAHFRPPELLGSVTGFYGGLWAGGVTYVMIFAGIIFGGDAIAGEFQNRTGYFLVALPLRRATVYVGKYLAALAASVVSVLLYLGILLGLAVYYFGADAFSEPVRLFSSFALALLYLLALLGTVFLFSSLFRQSLYGVLVVAVLFLFGWNLLEVVATQLGHIEPWFVISYAAQILPYPLTGTPAHAGGLGALGLYHPTLPEGISVLAAYFAGTSLTGLFLFERGEFT